MINNFPYFDFDATTGGSDVAWNDFLNDMEYFANTSHGKPLWVTQVLPDFLRLYQPIMSLNLPRLIG